MLLIIGCGLHTPDTNLNVCLAEEICRLDKSESLQEMGLIQSLCTWLAGIQQDDDQISAGKAARDDCDEIRNIIRECLQDTFAQVGLDLHAELIIICLKGKTAALLNSREIAGKKQRVMM